MSNGNPLEQLRRRMQSQATPTAFAALAEEYRRAGRFADAITVCREGLERYPAYASARVTLGRALLDSGDVPGAVAELELAAAQSPDNLAAARALQSAHDALGEEEAVAPVTATPPAGDLPLRTLADQDTDSIPSDLIARALGSGPDSPQEFGLGPDWSIPDIAQSVGTSGAAPLDEWSWSDEPPATAGDPAIESPPPAESVTSAGPSSDHAESPTMMFVAPHLQGDEPAGIWAAPDLESTPNAPDAADGARVFSWAIAPPEAELPLSLASPLVEPVELASVWDAPTLHAPLADVTEAEASSLQEAVPAGPASASRVHATDASEQEIDVEGDSGVGLTGAAPSPNPKGLLAATSQVDTSAPVVVGVGDALDASAGAEHDPWAGEAEPEPVDTWAVPDGPSAMWALGDLHEADGADATPFRDSIDAPDSTPVPFAGITSRASATADLSTTPAGVAWAGSVRSALGEVFALAGHGESLEPPTPASPAVRAAFAEAAVQAAIDDAALRDDHTAPVLTSLEQMLAAVRARRAELAGSASS